MKSRYSLVVIGGGPAGMAAAREAAALGVDVALLDEQGRPGGQIYRNASHSPLPNPVMLGRDYLSGQDAVAAFCDAKVDYFPGTSVWHLDDEREIGVLVEGENQALRGEQVVIATGAQERPMPLPGWELPGVMTAGAGQILLKSNAMVPGDDVVLAGSGPLLLLLAWQYLRAGIRIQALVDTTPRSNYRSALRHLPRAAFSAPYLFKGLRFATAVRRSGTRVYAEATSLRAFGEGTLEGVSFRSRGRSFELHTSTLLLHAGVIPQLHLPMAAGCEARWDEPQNCWHPILDQWGRSTITGISIAGDGGGIVGAPASALQGRLAGMQSAVELGSHSRKQRDRRAAAVRRSLSYHLAIRPFLDTLYRPSADFLTPPDETMVCRCEEVSAGEIRQVARLGCQGPNQAKAFTRCGMGPCQGRQCGDTVSALIAEVRGSRVAEVGHYRVRPPVRPVTLGQIAGSQQSVQPCTDAENVD